jgi:putative SOS response-associated peptidase YedK
MCGAVSQRTGPLPSGAVDRVVRLSRSRRWKPDPAPAQDLRVIRRHPVSGKPTESVMRWGLVARAMRAAPEMRAINARAETVGEMRMFAAAYRRRRCLIPMDAFYEWKRAAGKREAFGFAMQDGAPFGAAGIWEEWLDPANGEWERTFALVTVPANALVAAIHHRMPAILAPDHHARWLGPEDDPRDLLRPFPAGMMTMWAV